MKIAAATLSDDALFEEVAAIVHDQTGVKRSKITRDADLATDLGIAGDDGHELFERLHERFEMDWTGLEPIHHFGSEGLGPPAPWRLGGPVYERQPLTISMLIDALRAGRWPDFPLAEVSRGAHVRMHVAAWAVYLFIGGMLALGLWATLRRPGS